MTTLDHTLAALRAVAEPTRLRLLALVARGELTVSELTRVLGQSQPRVSRHLKLLCEAGLLDRFREGSWVFYRLAGADDTGDGEVARRLVDLLPHDDPVLALDRERLENLRAARAESALQYFRDNADRWDTMRSLHVDDAEVENLLWDLLMPWRPRRILDVGTGTGRMLEVLGPRVGEAVGVDRSREMLEVARANLERAGLNNCRVRQGDMYHLPFGGEHFDVAIVHQVLHYAETPAAAVAEAARVVRPGGRLVVVDFAPHDREDLRADHNHRRLGFADREVEDWCRAAGFEPERTTHLPGNPLTVTVWTALRPAAADAAGAGTTAVAAGGGLAAVPPAAAKQGRMQP